MSAAHTRSAQARRLASHLTSTLAGTWPRWAIAIGIGLLAGFALICDHKSAATHRDRGAVNHPPPPPPPGP